MWLKWHILTSKWWPLFGIVYKLIVPCEHSGTVIKAVFDVIVCFSSAWGFRPSVYHTIWELVKHHSTAASLSWQVQGLWLRYATTMYIKMNFYKKINDSRSSLRYWPRGILVGVSGSHPTKAVALLLGESRAYDFTGPGAVSSRPGAIQAALLNGRGKNITRIQEK